MRLRALGIVFFLCFSTISIWGQQCNKCDAWDDLKDDTSSSSGNPGAFSALGRLPAVRIVLYDPVSNSFGFVQPCPDDSSDCTGPNQGRLDSQRLALTTQKIRLLVMPYNARTTHLTLVKTNGNGVEFKTLVGTSNSATSFTQVATQQKKGDQNTKSSDTRPPADSPNAGPPKKIIAPTKSRSKSHTSKSTGTETPSTSGDWSASRAAALSQLALALGSVDTDLLTPTTRSLQDATEARASSSAETRARIAALMVPSKGSDAVLGGISASFETYRREVIKVGSNIDAAVTAMNCLNGSLPATDAAVNHEIADVGKCTDSRPCDHPFTLAYDRRFSDVLAEIKRRHEAIYRAIDAGPTSCLEGSNQTISFEKQVQHLRSLLDDTHSSLNTLRGLLDAVGDGLANIRNAAHPDVTAENWKLTLDGYDQTLKSLQTFHAGVQKQLDDARTKNEALLPAYRAMVEALEGPAAWVQRFNYPPLEDDQSLVLSFQRTIVEDGATPIVDEQNSFELRSAPTDAIRFSTGVVKSSFRNPTFKVGPTESDPAGTGVAMHQILFDDENNGATLPAVFVHHFWTRRCPMLQPTIWERLVPTLSLGLPIDKSDLLEQVLLGFDWELIPGVDLNVGSHFGRSNALVARFNDRSLRVGDYIPDSVDSSVVQSKRYTAALYFGISLNGDAFATLVGARK